MLIIDNSEYMRNGDYVPTRFDAQSDAVNTVFQTKIDSNPENTVGIMTMAGKGPEVLVTHSKDLGQILGALHSVKSESKIGGTIDIPTAISVALLALKHRENKNLRQRIVVFVGSPADGSDEGSAGRAGTDEKSMVRLAKKLKKNNVAVDFVVYGDGIDEPAEGSEQKTVLTSFVENASSGDNSHLVVVPPSQGVLLSEALIASPILASDRAAGIPDELVPGGSGTAPESGAAAGGSQFEFGVDPSLDPELAMALRMSLQEAQEAEARQSAASTSAPPPVPVPAEPTDAEEEALLRQAIEMSKADNQGDGMDVDEAPKPHSSEDDDDDRMQEDDEEDEDAAIQRAIEMSMMQDQSDGDRKADRKSVV